MKPSRVLLLCFALAALRLLALPAAALPSCCGTGMPASASKTPPPAILFLNLGRLHHPVSTKKRLAQRFFDQGLTLIYAFNFDEAYRSFQKAAEVDPRLAMADWGMAMSVGPNYNVPADADAERKATPLVQKAVALEPYASPEERAYITALAQRFSADPKADLKQLDKDYAAAMRGVTTQYPDDLDAATLYAESLMELHPWQLWGSDGTPTEGTPELLAVLESVLKRDPNHLGANHYYIHAVEASPHPEQALPCADRIPRLALGAGHIVHMPSHIYMRVGDYEAAATSNLAAIAADRAYFQRRPDHGTYQMYYAHNLDFLRAARCMEGRYHDAKVAADQTALAARPMVPTMPFMEPVLAAPTLVLVRFRRWPELLRLPEPSPKQPVSHAFWHYAVGLADAATGRLADAGAHLTALNAAASAVPADAMVGLNSAQSLLQIAADVLAARIAGAGRRSDDEIALLQKAVALQDAQAYDEPVDWYYPVRESLGGALLRAGRYADAERTFRDDLARNPRSGRSLFGLMVSLRGEGHSADAKTAQSQLAATWKRADTPLQVSDL